MKKPLPTWSIAAVIFLVLAGVGAGIMSTNGPSLDKDVLLKARSKPGGAAPASPTGASSSSSESYGHARGTPIIPAGASTTMDPRQKR